MNTYIFWLIAVIGAIGWIMYFHKSYVVRQQAEGPVEPWSENSTLYVAHFRDTLKMIATTLHGMPAAHVRLNIQQKCAELFFPCGLILAQVRVYGSFGDPSAVDIKAIALSDIVKQQFVGAFHPIEVKFEGP